MATERSVFGNVRAASAITNASRASVLAAPGCRSAIRAHRQPWQVRGTKAHRLRHGHRQRPDCWPAGRPPPRPDPARPAARTWRAAPLHCGAAAGRPDACPPRSARRNDARSFPHWGHQKVTGFWYLRPLLDVTVVPVPVARSNPMDATLRAVACVCRPGRLPHGALHTPMSQWTATHPLLRLAGPRQVGV